MDTTTILAQALVSLGTVALIATIAIQIKGAYKTKSLLEHSLMLLSCACIACVMLLIAGIIGLTNNGSEAAKTPINGLAIAINLVLFFLNFSFIRAKHKLIRKAKLAKISPEEYHNTIIKPKLQEKWTFIFDLLGLKREKIENNKESGAVVNKSVE